jgi:hypothetical protein
VTSDSDGVSILVAADIGGGMDTRGGEYWMQSDFTIFVIRAMLLFEEHMNLERRMSISKRDVEYGHARDEVLPWILSKHPDTFKPPSQLGKDGVLLAPLLVQLYEVNIQLEVVFEP